MRPDPLFGDDFTAHRLHLGADEEGPLVATLVRRLPRPDDPPASATGGPLLVLHGWSDYVLDRGLLEHLGSRGHAVWALDLRKYGRSLLPGQTPTDIDHLGRYDRELDLARRVMRRVDPRPPVLLAHSAGGLLAALYAQRRPGAVAGLALNSPWLEMHYGPITRRLLDPGVRAAARRLGRRPLLPSGPLHAARSTHRTYGGPFDYDLALKPARGHRFPASTFRAVLDGQRRLARNGPLDIPVLVLHAERSQLGLRFSETMRRADVVLDVRAMAAAAWRLGPRVTVVPVPGARHDVFLSDADARSRALAELDGWLARIPSSAPTMGTPRAPGDPGQR